MTKCERFLAYFDELVQLAKVPIVIPDEVQEFYNMLKASADSASEKPMFTETGLLIMQMLQTNEGSWKSRDIAEKLNLPGRKISGAMTKLARDGFVEKFGQNPIIYALTEKGKTFNLEEYNKGE